MEWKTIDDHPNYEVSDEGHIRNKKTGHILKPQPVKTYKLKNGKCYLQYQVQLNKKSYTIARLVANAFVYNTYVDPDGTPFTYDQATVDHINNDSSDNRAVNLQWVSHKYNVRKDSAKRVRDVDTGIEYDSARDAANATGLDLGNLCSVCRGRYKFIRDEYGNKRHFEYIKEL